MNTRSGSGEEAPVPGLERRIWGKESGATYPEAGVALEAPASRPASGTGGTFLRGEAGPRTAGGAGLERQLLLAREPGEDSIPRIARPSRARTAGLVAALAIVAAGAILFFIQVRGHWMTRAGFLEGELESARAAATKLEDVRKREAAEKDRAIEERRSENRNLAALAGKTLEELKTALEDVRKAREENAGLEKELRAALRAKAPSLRETLREWLSLARPVPASGPASEPVGPPSEKERPGGETR
jgi:hypothetical protein